MNLKSRLENKLVFGSETTVEDILIVKGKRVCSAVHPDYPHLLNDGRARGRKIHLDKGDGINTVCNMLVDIYIPARGELQPCMAGKGMCKVCQLKA